MSEVLDSTKQKLRPGQFVLTGRIESFSSLDDGRVLTIFVAKRVDDYEDLKSYKIFSEKRFGAKGEECNILCSIHSKVGKEQEYKDKKTGEFVKYRPDYVRFDLIEVF